VAGLGALPKKKKKKKKTHCLLSAQQKSDSTQGALLLNVHLRKKWRGLGSEQLKSRGKREGEIRWEAEFARREVVLPLGSGTSGKQAQVKGAR